MFIATTTEKSVSLLCRARGHALPGALKQRKVVNVHLSLEVVTRESVREKLKKMV